MVIHLLFMSYCSSFLCTITLKMLLSLDKKRAITTVKTKTMSLKISRILQIFFRIHRSFDNVAKLWLRSIWRYECFETFDQSEDRILQINQSKNASKHSLSRTQLIIKISVGYLKSPDLTTKSLNWQYCIGL